MSQVGPWPYIAPRPETEASHIIHIGSFNLVSISFRTGVEEHSVLMPWKQASWIDHQWNGCELRLMFAKGVVYIDMSGTKGVRYWTNPKNC